MFGAGVRSGVGASVGSGVVPGVVAVNFNKIIEKSLIFLVLTMSTSF